MYANVRLNDSFPVASLLLGAASLAPLRDREADRAKDHPAGLPPGSLKRAGSLKGAGYLKKTHGSLKTAPSSLRKASGSLKKAHGSLKRAPSSLGKASGSLKKAHGFLKTAPSSLGKVHGSLKTAPSTLRKTSLKKAASGSNSLDRVNRRVAGSIDDVKGVGDPNRLQARRAVHRVQTLKAKSGSLTAGTLARVNKQASKGAKRMDLPWGAFYSLESKDAEKVKMKLVLRAPQLMHKPSDGSALFLAYIARQLLLGKASAIESDDRQHVLNNIEFQWPTVEVSEGLKLSGFNGSLVLDVEGTEKAVKKSIAQIVNRAKNPPKMSKVFFEVLKLQFLKERLDHVKNDGWGHEKDIQQHVDIVMSRTSDLWPTHEQVLKSCEGLDFAALKKTGLLKSVELLPGLGLVQCRSGKASEVRAMLKSMNPKGLKVVLNRVSFKSVREVAGGKTRPVHLVEQSTGLPSSDTSSTSVSFQVDSKDPANALFSEFVKYFVDESHKSSVQSHARTLETNTRLVRAANGVGETRDNQLAGAIHASYSLHTFYIPHQNVLQLVMRYSSRQGKQHQVRQIVENYLASNVLMNPNFVEEHYEKFLQRTLRHASEGSGYVFSRTFNVLLGGERAQEIPLVRGVKEATFEKLITWLRKLINDSTYSVQTNCIADLQEMRRNGGETFNTYEQVKMLPSKYREPLQNNLSQEVMTRFVSCRKAREIKRGKKVQGSFKRAARKQ